MYFRTNSNFVFQVSTSAERISSGNSNNQEKEVLNLGMKFQG